MDDSRIGDNPSFFPDQKQSGSEEDNRAESIDQKISEITKAITNTINDPQSTEKELEQALSKINTLSNIRSPAHKQACQSLEKEVGKLMEEMLRQAETSTQSDQLKDWQAIAPKLKKMQCTIECLDKVLANDLKTTFSKRTESCLERVQDKGKELLSKNPTEKLETRQALEVLQQTILLGAPLSLNESDSAELLLKAIKHRFSGLAIALIEAGPPLDSPVFAEKDLLILAIRKGLNDVALALIEKGSNPNTGHLGGSPLSQAILGNIQSVILALIKAGASFDDQKYFSGINLLARAINNEWDDIAEALREKGAVVDPKKLSNHAFHKAVEKGWDDIAVAAINGGHLRLDLKTEDLTPLAAAFKYGRKEVVNRLIKAGATLGPEQFPEDPLVQAIDVAEALKKRGATSKEDNRAESIDQKISEITKAITNTINDPQSTEKELEQALSKINTLRNIRSLAHKQACQFFEKEVGKLMEEMLRQAETSTQSGQLKDWQAIAPKLKKMQRTIECLDEVLANDLKTTFSKRTESCLERVQNKGKELLSKNPTEKLETRQALEMLQQTILLGAPLSLNESDRAELLLKAIKHRFSGLAIALIEAGPSLDSPVFAEKDLLILAIRKGLSDVALALIEKGSNPNTRHSQGSPLYQAIEGRMQPVILALIKAGASFDDQKYFSDINLLAKAIHREWDDIAEALREKGAVVDPKKVSNQAFHKAVEKGWDDIAVAAINGGHLRLDLKTEDLTPLDAAFKYGRKEVVNRLIKAGATLGPEQFPEDPLVQAIDVSEALKKRGATSKEDQTTHAPIPNEGPTEKPSSSHRKTRLSQASITSLHRAIYDLKNAADTTAAKAPFTDQELEAVLKLRGYQSDKIKSELMNNDEISTTRVNLLHNLTDKEVIYVLAMRGFQKEEVQEALNSYANLFKASEPGKGSGLVNLGATCYLNSVLQTLRVTPSFYQEVELVAKTAEGQQKVLIDSLLDILKSMDGPKTASEKTMRGFWNTCMGADWLIMKQLSGEKPSQLSSKQQDAWEFLEWMRSSTNISSTSVELDSTTTWTDENTPDSRTRGFEIGFKSELPNPKSIEEGKQAALAFLAANRGATLEEAFIHLVQDQKLPVPAAKLALKSGSSTLSNPQELIDWSLIEHSEQGIKKTSQIVGHPPYAFLLLKRSLPGNITHEEWQRMSAAARKEAGERGLKPVPTTKNQTEVDINNPVKINGKKYTPHAVILHSGDSINGGHYRALTKLEGTWWLYDDTSVSRVSSIDTREYRRQAAVILYRPESTPQR